MSLLLIALLFAAVLLLLGLCAAIADQRRRAGPWPYYPRRVLTQPEQVLYWRLVEALPGDVVLAQVQLSRFLGIKRGVRRMEWLNRIHQKSADFVVCAKDFSVLAVVELDDATHARARRQKADADKSKAIGDAGLKLVRWHAGALPQVAEIRAAIRPAPVEEAISVPTAVPGAAVTRHSPVPRSAPRPAGTPRRTPAGSGP